MKSYQRHIQQTHVDRAHLSWCGKELGPEWAFTSIDHAVLTLQSDGVLEPCPVCVKVIVEQLDKVTGRK